MDIDRLIRILKRNSLFSEIMEKVYMDGYRQGQIDYAPTVTVDNVKYMDLGLPSETLWSCAPQYFCYGWHLQLNTYKEAKKLGLPTKEQWEELLTFCDVRNRETVLSDGKIIKHLPTITGPNGEKLGYPVCGNGSVKYMTYTLGENCEKGRNKFWLLSEPDEKHCVDVIVFDKDVNEYDKHYMGYQLPYFLVKTKG